MRVFMEMVHFIPSSQRRFALLAAQADSAPALICGGSGTGKGAIARWIHSNGPRSAKTFLQASQNKPLAEQLREAQGGTLMIPEMGEWPLAEQRVLLGYLKTKTVVIPNPSRSAPSKADAENPSLSTPQSLNEDSKEFFSKPRTLAPLDDQDDFTDSFASDKSPLVQETPMLLNVRIIGTTSQALEGRAQGGLFNIELLEKLNVFRIEMPPLAKRREEFEDIVTGIIGEIAREVQMEHIRGASAEAWARLKSYDWPGNLRELRNVLHFAVTAAKGDQIEVCDLPDFGYTRVDFRATREEFEKIYILELLKTFNWDIEKTCAISRMDKETLLSKIQVYGITLDRS